MMNSSLYDPVKTPSSKKTIDQTFLVLWLVFGLLGNLVVVAVVTRKIMRAANASIFIFSIAIIDMCYLAFKFAHVMSNQSVYLLRLLTETARFTSNLLIPLAALDRTAILFLMPLTPRHIQLTRKICLAVVPAVSLGFVLLAAGVGACHYFSSIRGCLFHPRPMFSWLVHLFAWLLCLFFTPVIMFKLKRVKRSSSNAASFNISFSVGNNDSSQRGSENIDFGPNIHYLMASRKSAKDSIKSTEILNGLLKDPVVIDPVTNERKRSNIGMRFLINKTKFEHRFFNMKATEVAAEKVEDEKARKFKEIQFSRMIVAIGCAFLLLSIPYLTYEMFKYHTFFREVVQSGNLLRVCFSLLDINHTFKFICYYLSSRRFRFELRKTYMRLVARLMSLKLCFSKKKSNNANADTNEDVAFNPSNSALPAATVPQVELPPADPKA